MIKSTQKGTYGDSRIGIRLAYIETKIISYTSTPAGRIYQLENYLVDGEVKTMYGSQFPANVSNEQLSIVDKILKDLGIPFTKEVNGEVIPLYGNELEWAKLPYGLLLFVQNDFLKDEMGESTGKTVFCLNPSDWVLC